MSSKDKPEPSALGTIVDPVKCNKRGGVCGCGDGYCGAERKPAMTAVQQGGEAARISPEESADYQRGWKNGYKHGAWASQPAAPHPVMDDKSAWPEEPTPEMWAAGNRKLGGISGSNRGRFLTVYKAMREVALAATKEAPKP